MWYALIVPGAKVTRPTGFIQFSLYSDKEVHTTVAFDIINDASNEVSHYYLYQENGHVTTLQLPVGNYECILAAFD